METKFTVDEHWNSEIARFLKGELTFSEEQLLQQWLSSDPANEQYFAEMRDIWLRSVTFESVGLETDKKWKLMNEKFNQLDAETSRENIHPAKSFSIRRIATVASLFLLAMGIGGVISRYLLPSAGQNADEVCEMITPLGAKSQIILPDGTNVWLNAGSRLTYKKSFNSKDRLVSLQGEAFFHVKTNKNKPFIVKTSRMNVKALGTSFNVKAYPEDKIVTATLVEGSIQVDGKQANSKPFVVTLKPKETISLSEQALEINKKEKEMQPVQTSEVATEKKKQIAAGVSIDANVNTIRYTSWKDAKWQVEAENLDNLSVLLGRRFNVVIHKESPSLSEYRFTGTLQNETLEQVLEILKLTTPLKYKIGKGEVWWDIDPVQQEDYSKILVEKEIRK
jgi:ferric-dicitrate binding protein FerR (iron transport regulator)